MTAQMIEGNRYEITYKGDHQRKVRTAVLDFIGANDGSVHFNARPIAGTQTMPSSWIISITPVSKETPIKI